MENNIMCPKPKQFIQRPGSSVLEEVTTGEQEAVTGSPKCNIWWFLLIAGGVISGWLCFLTLGHANLRDTDTSLRDTALEAKNKAEAVRDIQAEQFKHILYRLDEIDKKLDKRVSGTKMNTLAVE